MLVGGEVGVLRDGVLVVACELGGVGEVGFGDEEDGADGGDDGAGGVVFRGGGG